MRRRQPLQLESLISRINPSSISFIAVSSTLRFDGAAGEINNVTLSVANNGTLTINDSGNQIAIDPSANGLGFSGGGSATLSGGNFAQMNKLFILLGDNNDTMVAREIPIRVDAHGDEGNDTMTLLMGINAASNQLEGESGDDTLTGGSGVDQLQGDSGDDVLNGGDNDDNLDGGTGDDDLSAGDGIDQVTGGSGNDTIHGGDGSDDLNGNSGDDVINGGDGNDSVSGSDGDDVIQGGDGFDTLVESVSGTATLTATSFKSSKGEDTLSSIEAADISGSTANDSINASLFPGVVTLNGGNGNDTLIGGPGADALSGGLGNDVLKGNGGIDQVKEIGTPAANFTLKNTTLTGTDGFGIDTLSSIERASLTGGSGDNVINASAFTLGSVTLKGGAGADTLTGGSGGDLIDGEAGANRLFGQGGNDTLQDTGGDATVTGGAGNDSFFGANAGNFVVAETGNVNFAFPTASSLSGVGTDSLNSVDGIQLTGGAGNNVFDLTNGPTTNVTINGGLGADTIKVTMNAALTVLTNTSLSIAGGNIVLNGVEKAFLEGGASANKIDASAFTLGSVTLKGGAGNDTLLGGTKNDLLDGGADTDDLIGGPGVDTLLNGENNTQ